MRKHITRGALKKRTFPKSPGTLRHKIRLPTVASFRIWRGSVADPCIGPGLFEKVTVRRERDSNPRYSFEHTRLPSVHLRPLGHLSKNAIPEKGIRRMGILYPASSPPSSTQVPKRFLRNQAGKALCRSHDAANHLNAIPERGGFALRAASAPCILAFARRGLRIESPANARRGVLQSARRCNPFKRDTGERGIRTPDTLRYNGFRDRPIQPLSHLSKKGNSRFLGKKGLP